MKVAFELRKAPLDTLEYSGPPLGPVPESMYNNPYNLSPGTARKYPPRAEGGVANSVIHIRK